MSLAAYCLLTKAPRWRHRVVGWCCVWQDKRRPAESPCGDTCVPYFKGDYANLAHAMGLRYVYIDPAFASPQLGEPIWRMSVHVAAAPLARVARLLLRDQSDSRGDVLRTDLCSTLRP